MTVIGPDRYKLSFDSKKFVVVCPDGTAKFSGFATSKLPKLYVVTIEERPIYVGVTKRPIRNRLRLGWKADGTSGYYGYTFRHDTCGQANLDIWFQKEASARRPVLDMETVEAEVAFLIRLRTGQWPLYQTEIHFHQSEPVHKELAENIVATYALSKIAG